VVNADTAELARAVRDLSARVALSAAERRLLAVAIHGATRDELAARLGVNVHTLKSQIRRLLRKTGHRDLHGLRRALLAEHPAGRTPVPAG
jgi:DNA-binding CsgD family transcriptional regulator